MVSSLVLLRKKVLAFLRKVGLPESFGEEGAESVGVLTLDTAGFVVFRENVRLGSGAAFGGDAEAVCVLSMGVVDIACAGEGVASGVRGLTKSATCVDAFSGWSPPTWWKSCAVLDGKVGVTASCGSSLPSLL